MLTGATPCVRVGDEEMSCANPEPEAALEPRQEIVKKCVHACAGVRKRWKCAVVDGVLFTKRNSCVSCVHLSRVKEPLVSMSAICLEVLTYLIWIPGSKLIDYRTTNPDLNDEFGRYVSWTGSAARGSNTSIIMSHKLRARISFHVTPTLNEKISASVLVSETAVCVLQIQFW